MHIVESLLLAQDVVSLGIVGLMFVLVVVFGVLSAKQWHWSNVVLLVLCFITATTAIMGMTKAYKLRMNAFKKLEQEQKRFDRAEQEAILATTGDPASTLYEAGCLRAVSEELSREIEGRGRVWSNGQIVKENNNRIFNFANVREDDPDVSPLKDVVLYAFEETNILGQVYPTNYIGSVRVVDESFDDLTLEAVALADRVDVSAFTNPRGSWTLFEKMPLDRRDLLKKAIVALINKSPEESAENKELAKKFEVGDEDYDLSVFRKVLTNTPFMPAAQLGFDPRSREYEALIDRYVFDGVSIGKINNWIEANSAGRQQVRFEPAPEEVFIKYRFDEDSKKSYQVDANGSIENDGLFTPLGAAIDPALHAGREIKFSKDDTVLVDQRSADGYQRNDQQIAPFKQGESVTEVDRIFVRQVHDYPYEFSDIRQRISKLTLEIARMKRSNQVQLKSYNDAQKQIAERSRLSGELEEDGVNLEKDLSVITALARQRAAEVQQDEQTIKALEQRIQNTYNRIRQIAVDVSRRAFSRP